MIAGESMLLIQRQRTGHRMVTARQLAINILEQPGATWRSKMPMRAQCIVADGRLLNSRIVAGYAGGEVPVLRIVTECSRKIRVSCDHLLSTPFGYKRASELQATHDSVTIAPWPRKFERLTPHVQRGPEEPWHVYPRNTKVARILKIEDGGQAPVFDFAIFPFNNYVANEFVLSYG